MKNILCLVLFFSTQANAQVPQVKIDHGAISFENRANYDALVESDEKTKNEFYSLISSLPGFISLKNAEINNRSSIPTSLLPDIDFMANILNQQEIVKIGLFFYKINYEANKIYILHQDKVDDHYPDFLNENITTANEMGVFNLETDAIELAELGYKSEPTEEEAEKDGIRLFCWGKLRALRDRSDKALYFDDLSDPKFSIFSNCVNDPNPGALSTNTRLKIKLEYISLGIWFRLDIDGKLQRQDGRIILNEFSLWHTAPWGEGESKWHLDYDVVYKGRCRGDGETKESSTLNPPLNSENKTRKVFWERSTGLTYYCLKSIGYLYTDKVFRGPSSNDYFCTKIIFTSPLPREIKSTEVYDGSIYSVKSRILCQ